jgi:hypothetical protein
MGAVPFRTAALCEAAQCADLTPKVLLPRSDSRLDTDDMTRSRGYNRGTAAKKSVTEDGKHIVSFIVETRVI